MSHSTDLACPHAVRPDAVRALNFVLSQVGWVVATGALAGLAAVRQATCRRDRRIEAARGAQAVYRMADAQFRDIGVRRGTVAWAAQRVAEY